MIWSRPSVWFLAVGLCLFACLLVFLPEVPYWLDAPEFISAAWNLGHPHPPGHPSLVMLLKGFLLLFFGGAALKANMFSAAFGAASAALVGVTTWHILGEVSAVRWWSRMSGAIAAGLAYGVSRSHLIQCLSVEVYTLNAAVVLGAFVGALRSREDPRWLAVVSALLVVGFSNHHYLTVLSLPAIAVVAFRRRFCLVVVAGIWVFVLTSFVYLYLWIRGLVGAWPAWADTSSLTGLLWVVSARIFSQSLGGFEDPAMGLAENALKVVGVFGSSYGALGLSLAVGGLYVLLRGGHARSAVGLGLLIVGSTASKVFMAILDPENPDDHGYFLAAVAGLAVLQGVFAGVLGGVLSRIGQRVFRALGHVASALMLVAIVAVPSALSFELAYERARLRDPVVVMNSLFDEQAARSVMFLSHYPLFFQALYRQEVEGERPDVTVVQSSLYWKARGGAFYVQYLERTDKDLVGIVQGFMNRGRLDPAELRVLAQRRDVNLDPEERAYITGLIFSGWTLRVDGKWREQWVRQGSAVRAEREAVESHVARLRELFPSWPDFSDAETRRVVVRNLASMGWTLEALGAKEAAAILVAAAREICPLDGALVATAKRLGVESGRIGK